MAITKTINDSAFAALSTALNAYLALDPDTHEKLASLTGRVIAIELHGLKLRFYFRVTDTELQVEPHYEGEIDTTLSGTPLDLLAAGIGKNKSNTALAGDLEITGDVETGHQFQKFLQGIDIDWEEHLSRLVGDVAAHQAGNATRSYSQWKHSSRKNLQQDISEYLQEEGRFLPHPDEIDSFLSAVNVLRNDADRLELRIQRLQQKILGNTDADGKTQPPEKGT